MTPSSGASSSQKSVRSMVNFNSGRKGQPTSYIPTTMPIAEVTVTISPRWRSPPHSPYAQTSACRSTVPRGTRPGVRAHQVHQRRLFPDLDGVAAEIRRYYS
jgi:hypothetical protein